MKNAIALLVLFIGSGINAQNNGVYTSQIVDQHTNEILEGVSIKIKNSSVGTSTNHDGIFEIKKVNKNATVLISLMGYESHSISVSELKKVTYLKEAINLMDLVVISAGRQKQNKKEIPVAMSSISSKTLTQVKPVSIDEVLNQQSGVLMVDLGNEQHMMSIRQPITTKGLFLYLEDGIPIRTTGVFNHNALLEINMAAVKNIEIIRGSYSSLFGSEAIGGAVNFITANPSATPTATVGFRQNNNGYSRFDFSASNTKNNTGFYFSGYKSKIEDGIRAYGDYDKETFTTKITHRFNDKLFWTTAFTYVDYYSETSGSIGLEKFLAKDYASNHTFTYRDANSKRVTSTLKYDWNTGANMSLSFFFRDNVMGQNPSYRISNRTANDSQTNGEINSNSFKSYGFIGQHNFKTNDRLKLSVGTSLDISPNTYKADRISVYRNSEGIFESYTPTDISLSNYKTDLLNLAVYISGEYVLTEDFRFNFGLRADKFHYDFKNKIGASASSFKAPNTKNNFSSVTPRFGVSWKGKENLGMYANYSKGVVAPSVGDLYKKVEVPFLEPSVFNNFEIGSWFSSLDRKFYTDFAVYYLKGNNEVVSVRTIQDGVDTSENRNAGETEHYGVEYLFNYHPTSEIDFRLNGAYARHKYLDFTTKIEEGNAAVNYTGKDMPGAPKWIANTELTYSPNFVKGLRLALEMQFVDKYYTDQANTVSYESYKVFNARLSYKRNGMMLWSNILNITDVIYATRASTSYGKTTYTPGNPQTFNVGISYTIQ